MLAETAVSEEENLWASVLGQPSCSFDSFFFFLPLTVKFVLSTYEIKHDGHTLYANQSCCLWICLLELTLSE